MANVTRREKLSGEKYDSSQIKRIIHLEMLVLIQRVLFIYRFTPLSAIASLSRVLTELLRTFYCWLQIISGEQPAIGDARSSLKRTRDY